MTTHIEQREAGHQAQAAFKERLNRRFNELYTDADGKYLNDVNRAQFDGTITDNEKSEFGEYVANKYEEVLAEYAYVDNELKKYPVDTTVHPRDFMNTDNYWKSRLLKDYRFNITVNFYRINNLYAKVFGMIYVKINIK